MGGLRHCTAAFGAPIYRNSVSVRAYPFRRRTPFRQKRASDSPAAEKGRGSGVVLTVLEYDEMYTKDIGSCQS